MTPGRRAGPPGRARVREHRLAAGRRWLDIETDEAARDAPALVNDLGARDQAEAIPGIIRERLARPFERPRVTAEHGAVYFSFWWPVPMQDGPDGLAAADCPHEHIRGACAIPFGVLLASWGLVTLHPGPLPGLHRLQAENEADALLYAIMESVVGDFERLAQELADLDEHVSGSLREPPPREFFYRVLAIRQDALRLRHVLGPARAAFELLRARKFTLVRGAWEPYFDDLADRVSQVIDDVEDVRLSLRETLEAHTTIHNDRQNNVMKVLTVISTFTLPTTLVASIYGMNFHIPEYAWPHGYQFSLGLMLLMLMGLFGYLQWRGWFR